MDFSVFRMRSGVLLAVVLLTICMGTLQAASFAVTPATVTLTCNTATGPGAGVQVTVKPATGATLPITISLPSPMTTGLNVVAPAGATTLNSGNQTTGFTYTISAAAGCKGLVSGSNTVQFKFLAGGVADTVVNVTATITVTATATPLVATPSPVIVTCVPSGATPSTTVSVTSAATGGTIYTVNSTYTPAWLTAGAPSNSGNATSTASTFTLTAATCSGAVGSSQNATIHLSAAPAPDKLVPVTLMVVGSTPLTAANPSGANYTKNSGTPATWTVSVTSSPTNLFFTVDTTTLPNWLTVDYTSGTAPKTLNFSSTGVTDTMAPGPYSAQVKLKVSGYQDKVVTIGLTVKNPTASLSVAEGITRNLTWIVGQPLPTPYITAVSSDSPIAYTLATTGAVANYTAAQSQGLAYSFGTSIPVTFKAVSFAAAKPGDVLTGTVVLSWSGTAITVTFNVTAQLPGSTATLISVSPSNLPTAVAGQTFTVTLYGSGFVPSADAAQRTNVGIVSSGAIVPDANVTANVVNASTIVLTVAVPSVADQYLVFSSSNVLSFGVCNPSGGSCNTPTGTISLPVGSGPIVQSMTSASSFATLTNVAPYDMVSIFGYNFCSSNGSGCANGQVLYGTPDPVTLTYPTWVSPDAGQRKLTVTFQTPGTSTVLATAPILFATNNQINILVPATGLPAANSQVDIVVNFGTGTGAALLKSTAQTVTVKNTNPGIFTIDSNGNGAILNANGGLVATTNKAGMRAVATDSDTVQIYVTGLGAPTSAALISAGGSACVSTASYATFASLTNVDGAVMQSSLMNGHLPPCLSNASVSVSIGGVALTPTYAGWVPDSVAGLYQINVQLPAKGVALTDSANNALASGLTTGVQLPVTVTVGSATSQTGVNIWVRPRMTMTPTNGGPYTATAGSLSGAATTPVALDTVTATGGTAGYTYAVTAASGTATSSFAVSAGGAVTIEAPLAAGSYTVTITATDGGGGTLPTEDIVLTLTVS